MAKPFAWSYSAVTGHEDCPKRYQEVRLLKNYNDENEYTKHGNAVHAAFDAAIKNNTNLPSEYAVYQKWLDLARNGPGEIIAEQKYALAKDLTPAEWFSPRAWCRVIVDMARVDGPVAMAFDWKTGKVKEDTVQLFLAAQCIFSHFPEVQRVLTRFIWLQEDTYTEKVYDREQMSVEWITLLGRVKHLEDAYKTGVYPAKPSRLCRAWCPVLSCEHNGRRK